MPKGSAFVSLPTVTKLHFGASEFISNVFALYGCQFGNSFEGNLIFSALLAGTCLTTGKVEGCLSLGFAEPYGSVEEQLGCPVWIVNPWKTWSEISWWPHR